MIFPAQRGQTRPRVVRFSTSSASGLSSAMSFIFLQHYKNRTEDRDRRYKEDQHTDIEIANKPRVGGIIQGGPAHRTLRFGIITRQQHNGRHQNYQNQRPPPTRLHYGSSNGGGATGGDSLNWY